RAHTESGPLSSPVSICALASSLKYLRCFSARIRGTSARNRRPRYDVGSQMLRAASRLVKPSSMRGSFIFLLLALTTMASAAPRSARKTPAKANDRSEKNDKDTKTTGEKGEKSE